MSTSPRTGGKRHWVILAVVGLLALVAVVYVLSSGEARPTNSTTVVTDPIGGATPTTYASLGAASPAPSGTGTAITGTVAPGAQFNGAPGLAGNGFANSAERHTVVLHAWSTASIPALGWYVPTAPSRGTLINRTRDWSHTFTVYGNPKYAQLYLVTDYRGIRVNCTVTVDGVVQASGHSSGPYGDVMCMA